MEAVKEAAAKKRAHKWKEWAHRWKKMLKRDYHLILLCIPALIFIFIFDYGPMYGIQIAFKNYNSRKGIWGSDWVGFEHFIRFFNSPNFWNVLKNTLWISLYSLLASFPFPIFLAILINQVTRTKFKKTVQMVLYAPHFISVVVLCGMLNVFLSPSTGIVNNVLASMGMERIFFLGKESLFDDVFVWSGVWQNSGWGMIIYLAALTSIDPELYEAARIDGANKLKLIFHIEIPQILPTIVIMLIMSVGRFMNVGFQKAFLLQNTMNLQKSEIISTYVYRMGMLSQQFDFSTAVGLFNNIVNVILLIIVNNISRKLNETSLW